MSWVLTFAVLSGNVQIRRTPGNSMDPSGSTSELSAREGSVCIPMPRRRVTPRNPNLPVFVTGQYRRL